MTAVVLHLSDIHIDCDTDPILTMAEDVARCAFASLPSASHVFVVVSGDIANSGKAEQYLLAELFLKEVKSCLAREKEVPISFILAPGNHDCDFEKDTGTRKAVIRSMEGVGSDHVDDSMVETCTSIQEGFFTFSKKLQSLNGDRLWASNIFDIEERKIRFECLNVAWISKMKEDPGSLHFPFSRHEETRDPKIFLNLVVMHHPLNWFAQGAYRPFRKFVRRRADILITGHEHQGNVGSYEDAESGKGAFIEGCVLQHKRQLSGSSFNVSTIDLDLEQFICTQYRWQKDGYAQVEEGSWSTYRDLPAKRANKFKISESFQRRIDDPGAFLKHPASSSVTLTDIFVYPDLRKIDGNEGTRRTLVNATLLRSLENISAFALLEGDEKSGRTSLLYQLYQHYHDQGLCPVLLEGRFLRNHRDVGIDTVVRKAVSDQYGESSLSAFLQLPASEKVLLLDNLHDTPLKAADACAVLLEQLGKRFRYAVVTVDDVFEMNEILSVESVTALNNIQRYRIQQFGYTRRTDLIQRWFSLGADGTLDEAAFLSRCESAERVMESAMMRIVIPSIPLYLLTLLQSIEAGRSGDFKDSALGYYYQYLLVEAFRASGVKPDKFTENFQYAAHLAWHYHVLGKRELSEFELRDFNTEFSRKWHTVEFQPRLQTLVEARVLQLIGNDFGFRYPYVFYYLKGQYLSENLTDVRIREYVARCCAHLYVRDNANTVLFLAHHAHDDFVVSSIVESLRRLFSSQAPIEFNGDAIVINRLIQEAPTLIYSGESPRVHRQRASALRDELDDGDDGLASQEEGDTELSLVAQITALFKTTEILGQILKNQYAKISRTDKRGLISELFSGPLRALKDFYGYVNKNPEALVAELEAALRNKGDIDDDEKRKQFARKIAALFLQGISYAFVLKAAQSANSESLVEDIRDVVNRNGSLAYRLIELCAHLDSPKALPRRMLLDVFRDAKDELMPSRLLRIMVLNRLYMFKTTEKDMQWLSSELDLDLNVQHTISYKEARQRRLKNK